MLCFTYDEEYLLPANTTSNSTATTKTTITTESFDPFGTVWYYGTTTTVAAGDNIGDNVLYAMQYLDLRYSFNTGSTLTARKSVYLVMEPQSDGRAKLYSNPISQSLPTTDDGLLYKFLGISLDAYEIQLLPNQPIYYFKDGQIREWVNGAASLTASIINTALGDTPVARATSDADGNNIIDTYATKSEVSSIVSGADAMRFQGTLGTGGTVTDVPANHTKGDTYRVITAGTYAGVKCEIGDLIMCVTSGTTSVNAHWTVAQANIDGAVTGPATSTDAHVAVFSGTSGKLIKDSGYTIAKSVPSDAKFTDTTYTLTVSGSGNAVTNVTLTGTQFTVTKASPFANSSHAHGNIQSDGTMTATVGIGSGDKLAIIDKDDDKIVASSLSFGTGTASVLAVNGTWIAKYTHPSSDGNLHVPATGTTNSGKFLQAGSTSGAMSWVALSGSITGTPGAGKTLTSFTQSDGQVIATFSDISISKSQITDFPTSLAPSSHTHGNISNSGTISSASVTVANGDYIVISTSANNGKLERAKLMFDGSTATKALTQKGTWETFSKLELGTGSTQAAKGNHTHTTSLTEAGTSQITLKSNTVYTLSAGGTSVVFTMPNTASSAHTHTLSIETDTGSPAITFAASTTYKLTAGGNSIIFKTAPDTTYSAMTAANMATGTETTPRLMTAANMKTAFTTTIFQTGSASGAISVYGTDIAVKGLGSAAYTASTNYILKTIGTAAGDLIYFTASGTPARLAKGSDGQVLKSTSSGIAWGSDSNTDTKVTNTLSTITKYYVTGQTSSTTTTGTQVFDTGVYVTTTSGELNATQFKVNEAVILQYNSTTKSLDFIFA
jgi:hypothetical protein